MELDEVKAKIYGAFATVKRTDINFALEILELILAQDFKRQSSLFQYVCEIWGTIRSSEEIDVPERVSNVAYENLKDLHGDIINTALDSYTRKGLIKNWDRPTFYAKLWPFVINNPMWDSIEEKAFTLYRIAVDFRSPYYNVGVGLRMSNDDYSNIMVGITEEFQEFRFISALEFDQKTERASLIMNLLERLDSKEKKIVLMSKIIAFYNDPINKIVDELKKR